MNDKDRSTSEWPRRLLSWAGLLFCMLMVSSIFEGDMDKALNYFNSLALVWLMIDNLARRT